MRLFSKILIIALLSFFMTSSAKKSENNNSFINSQLSLKIGELILIDKYGDDIANQKPFKIDLEDSIWVVSGTPPIDCYSEQIYIEIDKRNCRVYRAGYNRKKR